MAASIEQIMAELDRTAGYASDRNILQTKYDALQGQADSQIAGLDAKLGVANDNILQSARARGTGFSGIPLAEQAKYAATDYAPAVAQVRQSQNDQGLGILSSLNALSRDQRQQAQSIYDNELAREEAAAARRAAAAAAYSPTGGDYLSSLLGGGGGNAAPGAQATMSQRKGGGFNFTVGGKAASLGQYVVAARAAGKNLDVRSLLSQMAKAGDAGAKQALTFVGGDMKYDPKKLTAQNAAIYNSLFWGVAPAAKPIATPVAAKPSPSPLNRVQNAYKQSGWS